MQRVCIAVAMVLAVLVLGPVGLWAIGGSALWLLVPGLLLLLLATIAVLGTWRGSGTILEFLRGQFEPQPKRLDRGIAISGGQASYEVQVTVNLDKPVGEVAAEYLSFALDTSQVVGGKWWRPQADQVEIGSGSVAAPVFDFDRPKLDVLTRALTPAYLRIGGSEADKVYYDLRGSDAQPTSPPGYESVLTRAQWDAVNAFAQRNGLPLIFTLNATPGLRRRIGRWKPDNAAELMAYSAEKGYSVAVWELGNELNVAWFDHGLGARVSAEQHHEDLQTARALVERYFPGAKLTGQSSAFWPVLGEPLSFFSGFMPGYLQRSAELIDLVSWHYYPQQSRRGPIGSRRACPSRLLDPHNLDEAGYWADRMLEWRDEYAPGKPVWLGETGNAQFGGEPGVSDTYIGGLWWLDQLGLLARKGHQVMVRQTLCGMNYGLLDDQLRPRPDYWNSLLWKHLMGRRVYAVNVAGEGSRKLRAYAHSTSGRQDGAVTVLAINLDHQRTARFSLPEFGRRRHEVYAITTPDVLGTAVWLNGVELREMDGQPLPDICGMAYNDSGVATVTVQPLSYTFVVLYAS